MSYISRIVSLKGFAGVVVGRDIGAALEPGHVYGIKKVMGVITLEDLGEAAQGYWQRGATISQTMSEGTYLLTPAEHMAELEKATNDYISDSDMEILKEYRKKSKKLCKKR